MCDPNGEHRPPAGNGENRPLAGHGEHRPPAGHGEHRPPAGNDLPHDLLDPHEPFDAGQWALHGLLTAYYESEHRGPLHGIDSVLERVRAAAAAVDAGRQTREAVRPSPSRQQGDLGGTGVPAGQPGGTGVPAGQPVRRLRGPSLALRALFNYRRWALGGGLAAAAVILLAVYLTVWPTTRERLTGGRPFELPDFAARCEAAVCQPLPMAAQIGDPLMLCGLDFAPPTRPARGGAAPSGSLLSEWVRDLDCGALDDQPALIEAARKQRDDYLDEIKAMILRGQDVNRLGPTTALMQSWQAVYRSLCAVGRWGEALDEIRQASAFAAGENPTGQPWGTWDAAISNDLAQTLEMLGDYDGATRVHLQSIDLRKQALRQNPEDWVGDPDEPDLPAVPGSFYGGAFVPPYLSMSWLAVLRHRPDGLTEARAWQDKAGRLFVRLFTQIAQANEIDVAPAPRVGRSEPEAQASDRSEPEAQARVPDHTDLPPVNVDTILALYRRLPQDFQSPPERGWDLPGEPEQSPQVRAHYHDWLPSASPIAWLRCWLYNEARLRRAAGDFAGAAHVLGALATLPAYRHIDEWRLDFFVPLESARVAFLRQDYDMALKHLDAAATVAGPLPCPWQPRFDRPAVGVLPRMEFDLLRGLVLIRSDRSPAQTPGQRDDGQHLIRQAMRCAARLAVPMSPAAGAAFLKQFQTWDELANKAR